MPYNRLGPDLPLLDKKIELDCLSDRNRLRSFNEDTPNAQIMNPREIAVSFGVPIHP